MIRWGILGGGNIARRFAQSMEDVSGSRITAVSCRSREKAEDFAGRYGIERAFGSHESLLEDDQVDAIYLALPHGLHCLWAVRALEAGKAVLCEKPAAMSEEEVRLIAGTARECGVLFMEAMKTRFIPAYREVRRRIGEGAIGEVVSVETSLCNAMPFDSARPTYHTDPSQGGALLDVGIYCACYLEDFLQGEPVLKDLKAEFQGGVDFYADAELAFPSGRGRLTCAFDRAEPRRALITGTKGKILVEELHRPREFTVFTGAGEEKVLIPYEVDDFYGEIVHFADCLKEGRKESPVMPFDASIRCARILDRIREGF
ncbi:MAG: Gfo/Idh/MocA family oxidoreductase [Lachnospiraceae bacterium]|nr:Gfo/Idh/MocA family oxidoreductase [Lachnospiraceae bacterium]